jgi:predicted transcriptional regulator
MKVKVNPKHVARVPFNEPNKMGVSEYEVLGEVSKGEYNQVVKNISDIKEFEATVYPISKNVKSFLATILTSPITKRLIRQKKIKSTTLKKYSYAKLERWAEKVKLGDTKTSIETARKEVMPLFELRKREGFTVNEVAQKANIPYKKLAVMEKQPDLNQEQKDQILKAIATLSGIRDISNSGLSVKVR